MKRKKVVPFEGFLEGSRESVERILTLLEKDRVLFFNQQEGTFGTLKDKYNLSFIAPVPKKTILRIDSNEETFLLDQTKAQSNNIFTVFNTGEQVPYIEYRGFDEDSTISLLNTGGIVYPHLCKFKENPNLKDIEGDPLEVKGTLIDAIGYFTILELPLKEKGSSKTYDELYRPERVYTFFDLLEDILKAETWRIVSDKKGEVPPAKVSAETKQAIKDFLQPFYEEEQLEIEEGRKLDLQRFNNIPSTLTPLFIGEKTYIATAKVANSQKQIYEETLAGQFALVDVGEKNKEHVDVTTSIHCEAGPPEPLDKYLQDSIGTMMQNSKAEAGATFSLDQITREFYGLHQKAKITQKARAEIEASIDKQRSAKVTIDFEEQARKHNHIGVSAKLEGNLLDAQKLTVNVGGAEIVGYRFLTLPIYYKYSTDTKQMSDVDRKMLSSKIATNTDPEDKERARYTNKEFALIKRCMIQHIGLMQEKKKKGQNWTNKCNYETIIKEVGPENPTEKQIRTIKKGINEYAEILKANQYIKDYKPYKNKASRAYNGIEIIL